MEINNFEKIKSFLNFQTSDDFYFLQILKRKKEHPELKNTGNNNARLVKAYYIKSLDYFDLIFEEIQTICTATNSRAYIHLNVRSFKKCTYKANSALAAYLETGFYRIDKLWNSMCGKFAKNPKEKVWMIDIDDKSHLDTVINEVKDLQSGATKIGKTNIIDVLPTKSGYHLIVKPFHVALWDNTTKSDIKKDEGVLLYFNDGKR